MNRIFSLIASLLLLVTSALAADVRNITWSGNTVLPGGWGTIQFSNFVINSADDAVAAVIQMPKADTITQACARYGARALTPVAHKISLQSPSTSALGPSGTILGGGSPAEDTFTPPADTTWDGTVRCFTLDNSIALTQGQTVVVVIAPTGVPDGTNNSSWSSALNGINVGSFRPLGMTQTDGGAWSQLSTTGGPVMFLRSATATYGLAVETIEETGISSNTTPDEMGNTFVAGGAAGVCDTAIVTGMRCLFSVMGASAKTLKFSLYDGTTRIAYHDADTDTWGGGGAGYRTVDILFDQGTLDSDPVCGNTYRIAVAPQETSASLTMMGFIADAAGDVPALAAGDGSFMTTRSDEGAWTDTTTKWITCQPKYGDFTEPAGGGGGGGGGGTVQIFAGEITQSEETAAERRLPLYIVDATDGVTEETGLTISGSECLVTKNGGAEANCAGTIVEVGHGQYYYQPTQGETDTLGYLGVRIAEAAGRKFVGTARIIAFDLNTAVQGVNVVSASTGALENQDFAPFGTAQAVAAGTITLAASPVWGTNALRNNAVHIVAADTGAGQTQCICSNAGVVATLCSNWEITPTGTITYNLLPRPACDRIVTTVTGNVNGSTASVTAPVTVGGFNAAGLADLFDTSSGTTYSAAVAGSVVKEIADNSAPNITIHTGTAQSVPAANQIRLAAGETYGNDVLANHVSILILGSSGATGAVGQVRCAKSNVSSTDTVTLHQPWKITPAGTVTYAVVPSPNCNPPSVPR